MLNIQKSCQDSAESPYTPDLVSPGIKILISTAFKKKSQLMGQYWHIINN